MLTLFCGFDPREAAGYHTFCASVIKRASKPVAFVPLASMGMPHGSNVFTLSRFLVPYFMGYKGRAIFMDACDMLCLDDVATLDAMFDDRYAVQVVKHANYTSQHQRKYIGTEMECEQSNYSRKNWASLMLINCEHPDWAWITPQAVSDGRALDFLQLLFLKDEQIGELPAEWNVLVDEGQEDARAKVLHWTAGIPTFYHYRNARRSQDWFRQYREIERGAQPCSQ